MNNLIPYFLLKAGLAGRKRAVGKSKMEIITKKRLESMFFKKRSRQETNPALQP